MAARRFLCSLWHSLIQLLSSCMHYMMLVNQGSLSLYHMRLLSHEGWYWTGYWSAVVAAATVTGQWAGPCFRCSSATMQFRRKLLAYKSAYWCSTIPSDVTGGVDAQNGYHRITHGPPLLWQIITYTKMTKHLSLLLNYPLIIQSPTGKNEGDNW